MPWLSRYSAVSWTVWSSLTFAEDGVTVTVGAGGATTMAAVADLPSLVSVIVAVPEPTAVTLPDVFTVATLRVRRKPEHRTPGQLVVGSVEGLRLQLSSIVRC